ncbi:MAG: S46 family peptidase [Polyangiaceae bacterium]|nr:S46 family peptidase [Polyangiaceae bacterium]MCL4751056.1 S46 family peptidase [Myxococcales bacterium]
MGCRSTLAPCFALIVLAGCSDRPAASPAAAPLPAASASTPAPGPKAARPEFENPGGMWLPKQLEAHVETLQKLGLELDPKKLADPMAYPLGAVVSLGGCSASFVSPEGLIVTNHHCVTGALGYNSTPEQNLLKNGYLAKSRAEEKWNGPTARVYVTQALSDVTDFVRSGLEQIKDDKKRHETIESREKELIAKCEKQPNVRCDLASYFGGGQYLLIEKLEIKDVRLVYAPHEGVGNFGGEIDNWRWPRHGGDFAFLRAYVGKDGKPADHSPDNVPYQPRMHLRLAERGLGPGDLVFVAGYPGRTMRLSTAEETAEAVEWYYPKRIRLFEDYLALIEKLGKEDPDVAIKARPTERGLANALTYTKGSLEGLTKGGAAELRKKREVALSTWIGADAERQKRFGEVLPRLEKHFAERKKHRELGYALSEVERMSSLVGAAHTIVRMAEERPKADAQRKPEFQQRNWQRIEQEQQALEKRYSRKLDSAMLRLALGRIAKHADENAKKRVLPVFLGKAEPSEKNIEAAVERLYKETKLEDTKTRLELVKKAKTAELGASKDPFIRLGLALRPLFKERDDRSDAESGALALIRPLYVAALREHAPTPVAPDANGTLRVTYGTVRGYRPTPEAPVFTPFTTAKELVAKATGKEPFDAPPRLVELAKSGKNGPYADPTLGGLPVDFLADLDITGGNSGSPTLNARGELVGLAFDGNYEAMASDWVFMPDITRSIHVDLRFMTWVMDAVDGADHLLREMGKKPAL